MKHSLAVTTIAVALGASAFSAGAQTNPPPATHKPEDVVARVGDHAIKWQELDTAVAGLSKQFASYGRSVSDGQLPAMRYDVLQQMITHELVLQDARGHEPTDLDEQVKKQIADVAKKFSEDKGSAVNGGDLGRPFGRGEMVPEFEAAAFSLKTNEVSDIVTTQFGYHILMVTDHQPAGERSFDDAKAEIEKYLR